MSELDAITQATAPATVGSIVDELGELGVTAGMTLMVHSSLSTLGYVTGGPQAVVQALLQAVGPEGTIMMPTHSAEFSDPGNWENPPVPESWWETIRSEMPAFDPLLTPTRGMGAIVECFRHAAGVHRSSHPTVSAAAIGPNAHALLDGHELSDGLGERSPQARLYDLDGHVLLLGVTHANNTSLHLSEYRSGVITTRSEQASPVVIDGERRWQRYDNLDVDEDDFAEIGTAFAATGHERSAPVGIGIARLMRSRHVVDFGVNWIQQHRSTA